MSTTIHVTIQDDREALAIVATLLNQPGYTVSIDLDRVDLVEPDYMTRERVEIHERLWDDAAMAATAAERSKLAKRAARFDAKTEPRVIHAGAKIHFDGSSYFIDGREVSVAEFDREMKMRMQARDERRAKTRVAINEVICSACGADVHENCRSASGKGYGDSFVHVDRIRALHTSHEAIPVQF